MKTILRLYTQENGKEVCEKDPIRIAELLKSPVQEYDLDYCDVRGHVFMGTSLDFVDQNVRIGEETLTIPEH